MNEYIYEQTCGCCPLNDTKKCTHCNVISRNNNVKKTKKNNYFEEEYGNSHVD